MSLQPYSLCNVYYYQLVGKAVQEVTAVCQRQSAVRKREKMETCSSHCQIS